MTFEEWRADVARVEARAGRCRCPSCKAYIESGKPQCAQRELEGRLSHALDDLFLKPFSSDTVARVWVVWQAVRRAVNANVARMQKKRYRK